MNSRGKAPAARAAAPAELRQLYQTLLQRSEEERGRVAHQLHNEVGQSLTAIKMALKGAQRQVNAGQATVGERLQLAESLLDETIQTVRRIAADLRPGLLDHFGLGAAVEWQMQQFSTKTGRPHQLQISLDESQVTPTMATVAFRILQEALTPLSRQPTSSLVIVNLVMADEALCLTVQAATPQAANDAARWLTPDVLAMHERAQAIGGRVAVVETTEADSAVMVWLPWLQSTEDKA